jgi:Zn-dependent peptidase ImmA (M78 family)/DNA-binding XRE family transcriptional regulator
VARSDFSFVGDRLRQARLAANLTATELADRVEVSRQMISAAEKGKPLGADRLDQVAIALGVPVDYFFQPLPDGAGIALSAINYRSLKKTPEFQKDRANSALEWAHEVVVRFRELLQMPKVDLPSLNDRAPELLSYDDIDNAARELRRHFGLGHGPIDKLILLLENHGVIVGTVGLSDDMDGVSAWYEDGPVVLVKHGSPAVRTRFDVAHELGHLVLHRHLTSEDVDDKQRHDLMEQQAHYFAGAFLLPEEGFVPEAVRVDLDYLLTLKRRWKVSIQAMAMRLEKLGILSKDQMVRFYQNMSRRNWRRKEPLDDELLRERPVLLERAAQFLAEERILPFQEAFTRTRLPRAFLETFAGLEAGSLSAPVGPNDNVLAFRRKEA